MQYGDLVSFLRSFRRGRFFHPRLQQCSGRSGRRFDRAAVVRVRGASVRGTVMAVGLAGPVQPQRHFLPSFGVAIILPSLYGFCWWVFSHFCSCHRCGSSSPVYITVPHSRRRASSPPHFPHRTLSSHTPVLRAPRKVGGCSHDAISIILSLYFIFSVHFCSLNFFLCLHAPVNSSLLLMQFSPCFFL